MISLFSLVREASPSYRVYLSRKVGYLVRGDRRESVYQLWSYLLRDFEIQKLLRNLSFPEKENLFELLKNFGSLPASSKAGYELEKKVSWIFKNPDGGVFIPSEIFKSMMPVHWFFRQDFMFALLYKLKPKELQDLVSILAADPSAEYQLNIEKNHLDMALVIFIWLSYIDHHKVSNNTSNNIYKLSRNLTLNPYISINHPLDRSTFKTLSKKVPAWNYLKKIFPESFDEISHWREVLEMGKKGFYRSLQLVTTSKSPLRRAFMRGLYIPHMSTGKNWDSLQIVTPVEIRKRLDAVFSK